MSECKGEEGGGESGEFGYLLGGNIGVEIEGAGDIP